MKQETKAALKQDKFVTTTSHGLEWASENRKSVVVTTSLLFAVIVAVVLSVVIYNKRSDAASAALGDAMQAYQTPLAQPGQPVPPGIKTFPSAIERAKAANAMFLSIADKYGMTPDGRVARYFVGLTDIEAGQTQAAEDTLKQVSSGWNSDLSGLAKVALAQLYRNSGRNPQAIDIYNQLIAKPTTTVPAGLAKLQLAELYQSEGNTDKAKEIYAKLKDTDPKGVAGLTAAEKLNPPPAAAQRPAQPPPQ